MLYQDMEMPETPFGVISQISDSTTSYGSILEQCQMKNNFGVSLDIKTLSSLLNPMLRLWHL
jgi:hypothetical protein